MPATSFTVNVGYVVFLCVGIPEIVQVVVTPAKPLPLVVHVLSDIPFGNPVTDIVRTSEGDGSVATIVAVYSVFFLPEGSDVV